MAQRKGFRANRRTIGNILKSDPGVVSAVDEIADDAAGRIDGGEVRKRTTDRHVAEVFVGAEDQAVNGSGTRAVNEAAAAFASRRQWRRSFKLGESDASERAHATPGGYAGLPERAGH